MSPAVHQSVKIEIDGRPLRMDVNRMLCTMTMLLACAPHTQAGEAGNL